jgi:hypothetical protein
MRYKTAKTLITWAGKNYNNQFDILYAISSNNGLETKRPDLIIPLLKELLIYEKTPKIIQKNVFALIERLKVKNG